MAELEQIKGTDVASEAIKKLDRNIKAVNLELEEGGTGPNIELVDNLNEENPGKALDARQGKILNNNKIDKTQIKNNLTETVAGNVLDATQGKALKELLDELRTGRGYLTTLVADGADFNTLINNGKYKIDNGTNKPDNSTSSTFLLDVTMMNSQYVYQRAACLYSNAGNAGKTYERYKLNNTWGNWVPVTDTAVQLWVGSITLSGTAQELTLLKSIATAKKVRFTFSNGASITSVHVEPVNAETTVRIGGNRYHLTVQSGGTAQHSVVSFPTETTCSVTGNTSWFLNSISGVY